MDIFKLNPTQIEDSTDLDEMDDEMTTSELIEAEIESVIQEMAIEHADTESYTVAVNNLETLTKAYANHAKAIADFEKAHSDYALAEAKTRVNWAEVGPKVAAVLVYGVVTGMFILIEREHPPAMRLVQAANTLITPRV